MTFYMKENCDDTLNKSNPSNERTNACYVRISGGARRTRALWLMVARDAGRRFGTSVVVADRPADPVQSVARFVIGAVLVVVANGRNARHSRITLSALPADALGSVRHRSAFRATAAHDVTDEARSDAVVVSAGLVVRTVIVRLALRCRREDHTQ